MKKAFLTGSRVYLRAFNEKDIDIWHSWFNDKAITRYSYHGTFPSTPDNQKMILEQITKTHSNLQLAIVLKKEDNLIGTIGLHKIDYIHQHGDISIVIGDKKCWGKGYAKEAVSLIVGHAFKKLNLHHITAGMAIDNIASFEVFKSTGFKKEGCLRKHKYIEGAFQDVVIMGILKDEYINKVAETE